MCSFCGNKETVERTLFVLGYGDVFLKEYIENRHPLTAFRNAEMYTKDFTEKEKTKAYKAAYRRLLAYVKSSSFTPASDEDIKFNAIAFLLKLNDDDRESLLNALRMKKRALNTVTGVEALKQVNDNTMDTINLEKTAAKPVSGSGQRLNRPVVLGPNIIGIPLQKGENVYFVSVSAKLVKKQRVTKRIDYSSLTGTYKITSTLKLRFGSINPNRITEEKFVVEDTGKFYITDRKLGFLGFKSFSVNLNKIVRVSMDYANNYVLIYKLNREKPYILQTDRNNDILQMLSNH